MGVDVASFGDYFADRRHSVKAQLATELLGPKDQIKSHPISRMPKDINSGDRILNSTQLPLASSTLKRLVVRKTDEPIKCLIYNDPFSSTYKKYIFTADGKYLLGGMMIGDVSDFVKLVAIVKKKVCFLPSIFGTHVDMIVLPSRKLWTFLLLNSSSEQKERKREMILMMMHKFVAVMCVFEDVPLHLPDFSGFV